MDHQHELRRSGKIQEMTTITRERSFVRPQSQHFHQNNRNDRGKNVFQLGQFVKPSMGHYKPPGIRSDGAQYQKLNVHAKEFTMDHHQQEMKTCRSQSFFYPPNNINQLQHSKSSSTIIHPMHNIYGPPPMNINGPLNSKFVHMKPTPSNYQAPFNHTQFHNSGPRMMMNEHFPQPGHEMNLFQSPSASAIVHGPRVHFQTGPPQNDPRVAYGNNQKTATQHQQTSIIYRPIRQNTDIHISAQSAALKRSKSLSSADSLANKLHSLNLSDNQDLGKFPEEIEQQINVALDDPNQLNVRLLMDLVKHIMERVVESNRYALPAAKLCLNIIEKERNETFLESLINMCQQWYQDKEKVLRNTNDCSKFTSFMWFLTEMSSQLKRRQLQLKSESGADPGLILLRLLVKCCQCCVQPPKSLAEVECLFFVLSSIGREMETELPKQLDSLLECVRDGFLSLTTVPQIRKTLLQLIELKASNWQLSGSTVLYYYPKMK